MLLLGVYSRRLPILLSILALLNQVLDKYVDGRAVSNQRQTIVINISQPTRQLYFTILISAWLAQSLKNQQLWPTVKITVDA